MAAELISFYQGKGEDDEVCCLGLGWVECIYHFLRHRHEGQLWQSESCSLPYRFRLVVCITLQAFCICYSSVYEAGVSHHRPVLSYRVF